MPAARLPNAWRPTRQPGANVVRLCRQCRKPFDPPYPPNVGPPPSYCSDACRQARRHKRNRRDEEYARVLKRRQEPVMPTSRAPSCRCEYPAPYTVDDFTACRICSRRIA